MTDQSAVAREIVATSDYIILYCDQNDRTAKQRLIDAIAEALTRARQEGERDMREAAAKVAEAFKLEPMPPGSYRISSTGRPFGAEFADRIRALPLSAQPEKDDHA